MPKLNRAARIATAATFAVAITLGTSACTFATLDGVTPGAGSNVKGNGVSVMNVVLVGTGNQARVIASVQTPQDDTLVSISGAPSLSDGTDATPYQAVQTNLSTPANTLVVLDPKNYTLTSPDSKPGLTADVTFNFAKEGAITIPGVTITGTANPDYTKANIKQNEG